MFTPLPLDDPRWKSYRSGYGTPLPAVRPWLSTLITDGATSAGWELLWDELHHQGDVGEASYAVVPHLAAWLRTSAKFEWEPVAFAATVELCRCRGGNPDVPPEVTTGYFGAIREFPLIAQEVANETLLSATDVGAIAAITAAASGHTELAEAYLDLSPSVVQDFLKWQGLR